MFDISTCSKELNRYGFVPLMYEKYYIKGMVWRGSHLNKLIGTI
jgi:hypothetical protein